MDNLTEFEQVVLGCMVLGLDHRLKFVLQEDSTVAIYTGQRLLTQIETEHFIQLKPQEVLDLAGI